MFDIFNIRKKNNLIKKLEETIYNQEEEIKNLNSKLDYAKYEALKDSDKKTIEKLMEENKILTEWVIKILNENKTCETNQDHFIIPIYRNNNYNYCLSEKDEIFVEKEYIEIPHITIVKERSIKI